jgi:hypothetical protein
MHRIITLLKCCLQNATGILNKFGITEIYPTKENGREWYLNMSNPYNDTLLSITFEPNNTRQADGSWRISETNSSFSNPQNSLSTTDSNRSTASPTESEIEDIAWYARGGKRNEEVPCEGTAYFGGLHPDGTVSWKKSIWWTGGYTEDRLKQKVLNEELIGKWIGWKVVIYNMEIGNLTGVKMESYLDFNNTENWSKVTELFDSGGWYARTSNEEFYGAQCGKPKDYIVTNSGPIATFRSDNIVLDFKDFSIREIHPPSNLTLTSVNVL